MELFVCLLPEAMSVVQEEHRGIQERRLDGEVGLAWEDTKNMPYTLQVRRYTLASNLTLQCSFVTALFYMHAYDQLTSWLSSQYLNIFNSLPECSNFEHIITQAQKNYRQGNPPKCWAHVNFATYSNIHCCVATV